MCSSVYEDLLSSKASFLAEMFPRKVEQTGGIGHLITCWVWT